MTEFENDFDTEEASTEAAADTIAEEMEAMEDETAAPTEAAAPTEDDFFSEAAAPEVPAVDPMHLVTIQTTSASDKFVEVDGPKTVLDLIHMAQLQFAGDFSCFLNGAQVELTTLVPGGSTVTIAGKVKGG
jgi:hypothetical protein